MKLTIISGQSGSGKTIALHALEDDGYYCIDNLPVSLLPDVVDNLKKSGLEAIALGIDARGGETGMKQLDKLIHDLRKQRIRVDLLYLSANENTLLRRYSETRRKHPLSSDSLTLLEAIRTEKSILETVLPLADLSIDTSRMNVHQLSKLIHRQFSDTSQDIEHFSIQIQSFGFKYGVPQNSDYVFDVRSLPNPHWVTGLKSQTGLDKAVINFLESHDSVDEMFQAINQFLAFVLPQIMQDNRRYLGISIGCTGGQHRSVYLASRLSESLQGLSGASVNLNHRELGID